MKGTPTENIAPAAGKTLLTDDLSRRIIGCLIEVHKTLGPGLLENVYERCLAHEFTSEGIAFEQQLALPVIYKGLPVECGYRIDMLVERQIILELKSVESLSRVHEAQLMTYLKLCGLHHGFPVNFNVRRLTDGLKSIIL